MRSAGIGLFALVSLAVASPGAALAGDGLIRFTAGAAQTDYSIKFDGNIISPTKRNKTVESEYTAYHFSLTMIAAGGFYVDLGAQQSESGATHDLWTKVANGSPRPQPFSHDAYTITLGYAGVLPGGGSISGFGGYRSGTTILTAPGPNPPAGPPTSGWTEDKFESNGFFFGMGGGFPALGGTISMSGAIAFMSGKWTDNHPTAPLNEEADFTFGYSAGIGYTYRFGKSVGVTLDYRYQLYNYDFNTYSTINPAYSIVEKVSAVGLKVSAQF